MQVMGYDITAFAYDHVNGQTGKVIGKTPTDKKKAWIYSGFVAFMVGMIWQCVCWILGVF